MKLLYSPASPYARKVIVVAHERGLADRIELVPVAVLPTTRNDAVSAQNPLGKVPTLILEDGSTLFDSPLVAEYLDTLAGPALIPASGPARWQALRLQAAADGLLDAALLVRYERAVRPVEQHHPGWIDGQMLKIRQAADYLEAAAAEFGAAITIGEIATACALGYLDFRFADENWRVTRPALAAFYAKFAERPSMLATVPPPA